MTKALVTGITGFVGSHLADYLIEKDYEVYGTIRSLLRSDLDNIKHIESEINLIEADIVDAHSMKGAVSKVEPDYIFHLAAQTYVPTSWHAPQETLTTNIIGTVNLLEAVRSTKINPKIHVAGSSEEYGLVLPDEIPIKETNPLRPMSPYGVSKVAQENLGLQYNKSYNMPIFVTRAFNHTGPRRGRVFVCSDFSKQIAEIEKELGDPVITVGDLDSKRDFTDVRDVVRAYHLCLENGKPGEVYNVCSGESRTIRSILETLLEMTDVQIEVKEDPDKMRPSDVPILQGDYSKFKEETGWEPTIPFKKSLQDLLGYWREKI